MARARPTRFCMPPDSSDGRQIGDVAAEADLGQLLDGDIAAFARAMPWPWIRPKATFSQTGRLSNSAPPWNSMPNFFITASRAAPLQPGHVLAIDQDSALVRA